MALFPGLPGWAGTRKVNQSGFYWSKRQWVAVASAGPYASLHLAPDRLPCQHLTTPKFFTGRMPFLPPNQQRQSTEGTSTETTMPLISKLENAHESPEITLWTYTHPFNGPFSGTIQVSRYQNGKTNLDFTEARDSEWLWHQLGHMQVCTLLQTDNHASTPPLFLQAGCPSCRPTNSVKALKALWT